MGLQFKHSHEDKNRCPVKNKAWGLRSNFFAQKQSLFWPISFRSQQSHKWLLLMFQMILSDEMTQRSF